MLGVSTLGVELFWVAKHTIFSHWLLLNKGVDRWGAGLTELVCDKTRTRFPLGKQWLRWTVVPAPTRWPVNLLKTLEEGGNNMTQEPLTHCREVPGTKSTHSFWWKSGKRRWQPIITQPTVSLFCWHAVIFYSLYNQFVIVWNYYSYYLVITSAKEAMFYCLG